MGLRDYGPRDHGLWKGTWAKHRTHTREAEPRTDLIPLPVPTLGQQLRTSNIQRPTSNSEVQAVLVQATFFLRLAVLMLVTKMRISSSVSPTSGVTRLGATSGTVWTKRSQR